MSQKSSPIAVLISDVHFSVHTIDAAVEAMCLAIEDANKYGVSLIVTGDIHDTKANIRAECVKALIGCLQRCEQLPIVLVGNHDLINERNAGEHALDFLNGHCIIVDKMHPFSLGSKKHPVPVILCPYQTDPEEFEVYLRGLPEDMIVLMHQGLKDSDSGEYLNDKTAISYSSVEHLNVLSGHYHRRQVTGNFQYLGNPYTLNFGEADHPVKGHHLLFQDGTTQLVENHLRRHVIIELHAPLRISKKHGARYGDIVKIKVYGTARELAKLNKDEISRLTGVASFRLEKIQSDTYEDFVTKENKSAEEQFDHLIESLNESAEQKKTLKELWREIL